jgi:hypothetical protein
MAIEIFDDTVGDGDNADTCKSSTKLLALILIHAND